MCDGLPGDDETSSFLLGSDVQRLEFLIQEFVELFQGEGADLIEQLNDAHRKSVILMTGVDRLCGLARRHAPYMVKDSRSGRNDASTTCAATHSARDVCDSELVQERFVRAPDHDQRMRFGDSFAGDAWMDLETGGLRYFAIGVDPNGLSVAPPEVWTCHEK